MRLRLTLALGSVVLALALAACGGGSSKETATPGATGTQKASPTAAKTTAPGATSTAAATSAAAASPSGAGGGGASLGNVPVYPGATKVSEGSGASPIAAAPGGEGPAIGDYSNLAWAIYQTGDSVDKVATFYKGKMPDNGWTEQGWFDASGVSWGAYTRDNGNTAAWIAATGDGQTSIVIGTGSR